MTKNYTILLAALVAGLSAFGQPTANPVEKGNKQVGVQLMLAPIDVYWTATDLYTGSGYNTAGIHLAGNYGWFVERGWMIGVQLNAGYLHEKYAWDQPYGTNTRYAEVGIAPMTRYYFGVDKKHRFKPFLLAGLPITYAHINEERKENQPPGVSYVRNENNLELRTTFGFGAGYFGKAGNIELHISNMGFFLQLNKFLSGKKSDQ